MNVKPTKIAEETLTQLDIREIEQRLEISPLLATTETGDLARDGHSCTCKIAPEEPQPDNPPPNPDGEG